MPSTSERLLFWDKKFATLSRFTPQALLDSYRAAFNETISERTLKEDIKKLREDHNAPIRNERFDNRNRVLQPTQKSHYSYEIDFSIAPKVVAFSAEDAGKIQQAITVLKQFQHLPPLKDLEKILFKLKHEAQIYPTELQGRDIIAFEQVSTLVGFDRLEALYRAIQAEQVLSVYYKPFDAVSESLVLHPYFLKEFNNRWFVYGLNQDEDRVVPYAFDRIVRIEPLDLPFRPNQNIDFSTFFRNRIGITYYYGDEVVTVRLKVAQPRAQYIITKPWHLSQILEEETALYAIFKFNLVCNKELETQVLSFGKDIEVLEPPHLRTQIQKVLITALRTYK
jgi:predicted DNA-binding transcriptional regulator YafY